MKMMRLGLLAAATSGLAISSGAMGAAITFGTPTTFSGDTDISNPAGATVVSAITFAGSAVTVNGVSFTPLSGGANSITSGILTLKDTSTGNINNAGGAYGSTSAPFANLSANLKTLLSSGVYNDGQQFQLTYSGLTIGQTYQFETLVNDSRPINRSQTVTSGGNTATLLYSSGGTTPGSVGQFVIGTFTADSTTQVINYNSTNSQINATVLEALTPEPASLSLLAFGGLGLLARRRHRA